MVGLFVLLIVVEVLPEKPAVLLVLIVPAEVALIVALAPAVI